MFHQRCLASLRRCVFFYFLFNTFSLPFLCRCCSKHLNDADHCACDASEVPVFQIVALQQCWLYNRIPTPSRRNLLRISGLYGFRYLSVIKQAGFTVFIKVTDSECAAAMTTLASRYAPPIEESVNGTENIRLLQQNFRSV